MVHPLPSSVVISGLQLRASEEKLKKVAEEVDCGYHHNQGVFSDQPYICLMEYFWHAEPKVTVERFYVINTETSSVSRYTQSIQVRYSWRNS